jgi:hypothetical protein
VLQNATFIISNVALCNMKDTIRLSQRNKDRLSFYDDDGNRAIEKVLDAFDTARVRENTRKEFEPLLQNATLGFATGATYSCNGAVPSQIVTPQFDPAYWKKMKETIDTALEPYIGRQ